MFRVTGFRGSGVFFEVSDFRFEFRSLTGRYIPPTNFPTLVEIQLPKRFQPPIVGCFLLKEPFRVPSAYPKP